MDYTLYCIYIYIIYIQTYRRCLYCIYISTIIALFVFLRKYIVRIPVVTILYIYRHTAVAHLPTRKTSNIRGMRCVMYIYVLCTSRGVYRLYFRFLLQASNFRAKTFINYCIYNNNDNVPYRVTKKRFYSNNIITYNILKYIT